MRLMHPLLLAKRSGLSRGSGGYAAGGRGGGSSGWEEREGRGGGEQLLGEARRKVAPRRPAPRGSRGRTRQPMAAQRCTADGVRLRGSFLPPLLPPPPVLRSQSRRRVARRWNGWSPDTHHHLSCTREAWGSAAPRGCGCGSGEAGECGRAAPRAGDAGSTWPASGGVR